MVITIWSKKFPSGTYTFYAITYKQAGVHIVCYLKITETAADDLEYSKVARLRQMQPLLMWSKATHITDCKKWRDHLYISLFLVSRHISLGTPS